MELIRQSVLDHTGQVQSPQNGGPASIKNIPPQVPDQEPATPAQARQRLSLDGVWQFQFDPTDLAELKDLAEWREAHVPMPWQAEFEDLREQAGTGWYQRNFELPAEWAGGAVILHFGAVDYYAQVWLNGSLLGEHAGGYLPFEFEISDRLNEAGPNELAVRVTGPIDDPQRYPDFSFSEIPHGKQSWYGPLNGIWQSVWLECRAPFHIQTIFVQSDLPTGAVQAGLTLSTPARAEDWALLNIVDPHGMPVASSRIALAEGDTRAALTTTIASPLAWSPDQPHLYRLEVCLGRGEAGVDTLAQQFGFRTIEAREGRLFLNGEPIYLRGALDQDYYPDTIATPPSVAFLEDQLRKAKELGLNCLRCHIKVADPRYYEAADRHGMLIWTELPNWRLLTEGAARRGRATLQGIVERDGHHPSIIAWTIINEDWGTDLVHNATHRAWLKTTYQWLKELDPTRLVVDNSPCRRTQMPSCGPSPDQCRRKIGMILLHFASQSRRRRCLFQNLVIGACPMLNCCSPGTWWFETGREWDDGVVRPHGVRRTAPFVFRPVWRGRLLFTKPSGEQDS